MEKSLDILRDSSYNNTIELPKATTENDIHILPKGMHVVRPTKVPLGYTSRYLHIFPSSKSHSNAITASIVEKENRFCYRT